MPQSDEAEEVHTLRPDVAGTGKDTQQMTYLSYDGDGSARVCGRRREKSSSWRKRPMQAKDKCGYLIDTRDQVHRQPKSGQNASCAWY